MSASNASALDELDKWWTRQRPRWMDVISDFAGQELFIIDGDALIEYVLDNNLLALGKDGDPSFQLLHAIWLLETTVQKLLSRDCAFEVVFFQCNRHFAMQLGESDNIVAARTLARSILSRELSQLPGIASYHFENLESLQWKKYFEHTRPMFYLGSDGFTGTALSTEKNLVAKVFLFQIMAQGMPVVLLKPIEFKDNSKMLSLVYDRSRHNTVLAPGIQAAADTARETLELLIPAPISAALLQNEDIIYRAASACFESGPKDPVLEALLFLYIAHVKLLEYIPLPERAQKLTVDKTPLLAYLETTFFPFLYKCITAVVDSIPATTPLPFLHLDGRIFYQLVVETISHPSLGDVLGQPVFESVSQQWMTITKNHAPDMNILQRQFGSNLSNGIDVSKPTVDDNFKSLLPFSNPIFDGHLKDVHVRVDETDSSLLANAAGPLGFQSVFVDDKHWHNEKPLVQKLTERETAWQQKKKLRQEQKFMAHMQKSAASLTGASGAILRKITIPMVGKRITSAASASTAKSKSSSAKPAKESRPSSSSSSSKMSKADQIKAENIAKKEAEERLGNEKWWKERLIELRPLDVSAQIELIAGFIASKRTSEKWLGTEIMLKRLDLEIQKWIADPKREDPVVVDGYRVYLARTIVKVLQDVSRGKLSMSVTQGKAFVAIIDTLNLRCMIPDGLVLGEEVEAKPTAEYTNSKSGGKKGSSKKEKPAVETSAPTGKDAALSFEPVPLLKKNKAIYEFMTLKEDPIEFQLRCMGEYMTRSLDSQPDSRVDFEPDKWQREVLDGIDNDESMLIVAPTSSGKTFISFAAMERVLRESDDGIVVYVAPTKALVNQVAAEVFARFSKTVPSMNLWAIHTRDYRINDPQKCQVLVTVPHILSIMLLSPAIAEKFTSRIRRVIIDEIHSISEEGAGNIWEQIILMNPAPVIGLSATVGAPERFSDWLKSVESNRGRPYKFVHHRHRFNALRKFVYAPTEVSTKFGPLQEHQPNPSAFPHVHPIAALALGRSYMPEDLSLEPRDTLSLWKAMVKSGGPMDAKLKPATFFAKTPSVALKEVIVYEKDLKETLLSWLNDPKLQAPYHRVIDILSDPLTDALTAGKASVQVDEDSDEFYALFLPLLYDLNAQNSLPAIIFNFDRNGCEVILQNIVSGLTKAETAWRATSVKYQRLVEKANEAEKNAKARAKKLESMARNAGKDDDKSPADNDDSVFTFDPSAPSPEFTFVGKGISQIEFEKDIAEMKYLALPDFIIDGLRRGVGVHHAGMNRRYRVLVENYFRLGVLRVVIATGTLSLGINAPAKSCIFGGDSVFLTALNFRQCSGRAGRRGFDNIGNVVFVGIPQDRIQRLLLSRLPKLVGTFPLTTTLIVRLFILLHGAPGVEYPIKAIEGLLALPQLSVTTNMGRDQLSHFVRFSIEYLRRVGLLDSIGRPLDLCGMVSHLYPYEPSNFAIAALLHSEELHKIAADIDTNPLDTIQNLCVVFAHLFARVIRRRQSPESLADLIGRSASQIILPPLPKGVTAVLDAHNKAIVTTFANYARAYAAEYAAKLGVDDTLPLSGRKIQPVSNSPSSFVKKLGQTKIAVYSRSPFVATSGHDDSYAMVSELSDSARSGLSLSKNAVPFFSTLDESELQLDAYAPDFLKHGSLTVLVRDNCVRRGDAWFLLQDFDLALSTIKQSLERLLGHKEDSEDDGNDSDEEKDDETANGDTVESASVTGVSPENVKLMKAITLLNDTFHDKFRKIFS
ncbi:hypothetical protein SmJEL517_g01613 [Synchytrium microbalum]|uniref:P-loop containing nucleoside triphosphate hydrolase protein n=1 Tax=Synchytrium microbalum TaxID=1806994 RepID=A0A507C970_9FUNG|nr:uncharacterized protein SmJEL517_g01613 [Synchytrium microbalum]TPX36142.1 hypothetical protein SmJEL517_g01613 [Synchytrium microbalum]